MCGVGVKPVAHLMKFHLLHLFIYLGFLRRFQHCTGHITTSSWKGRGNQYIQFVRVLYCKLPTNGKQLPAFPLEAVLGIEPRPQRWEARLLPLCHRGPIPSVTMGTCKRKFIMNSNMTDPKVQQDFKGQYSKVKGQSVSHHDMAHLKPSTNVPTKYKLPTPYSL